MFFDRFARRPAIAALTPQELAQARDAYVVVDVRSAYEVRHEYGLIPGAHHVPLERVLAGDLPAAVREAERVVFVCRSGNRSAHACMAAANLCRGELYNLQGGMLAWSMAGLPVERP